MKPLESKRFSPPAERAQWSPVRLLVRVFTDDLKTKAVALVCAIFIWFLVSGLISDQAERMVPIQLHAIEGIIVESQTKYLKVTLEGPRESLRSLDATRLTRPYSVGSPEEMSSRTIDVPAEDLLDLPAGVRVAAIEPHRVRVDVQRVVLKYVGIQPDIVGELDSERFRLGEPIVTPSEVRVYLPIEISERDTVKTLPIEVGGRDRSFTQRVQIATEVDGRRIKLYDDRPVQVRVTVEEKEIEATVDAEILILRPGAYPLRVREIDPKTVKVRVAGAVGRLPAAGDVKMFVDLRDLESDKIRQDVAYPFYFRLRSDPPDGLRVVETYNLTGSGEKQPVEQVSVQFAVE